MIYCKELAHATTEAEKSRALLSAVRKAGGVVLRTEGSVVSVSVQIRRDDVSAQQSGTESKFSLPLPFMFYSLDWIML